MTGSPTLVSPSTLGDAGNRSLRHYQRALPRWRYELRRLLLPLIRWETPWLHRFQRAVRNPVLDRYFAISANLGTHTFFFLFLPALFWGGWSSFGKGLVHILALGVIATGFLKDMLSLPRPLSPPLYRLTMSGSAALEYGFPSTHSCNAVSVAVYAVYLLHSPSCTLADGTKWALEIAAYFYAASIVVGRLYCGMHGFLDVAVGSLMGWAIAHVEFVYGPPLDLYMQSSSWKAPLLSTLAWIVLLRIHPEPADDCPCFDDSVSFTGVLIGLEVATWTFGKMPLDPWDAHAHGQHSVSPWEVLSAPAMVARMATGIVMVAAWRGTMKPLMLRVLPHVFRQIEKLGIILPRRFFKSALDYQSVPNDQPMDTVFPRVSEIPRAVHSIQNPQTRGRSVSIGPQSAADAYEALAYRERQRQQQQREQSVEADRKPGHDHATRMDTDEATATSTSTEEVRKRGRNHKCVDVDGRGRDQDEDQDSPSYDVFAHIAKTRVRYDVEVVTKLVVYSGIGWLSVSLIPIWFEVVGLGVTHLR